MADNSKLQVSGGNQPAREMPCPFDEVSTRRSIKCNVWHVPKHQPLDGKFICYIVLVTILQAFLRLVRYLCSCGHLQPLCRLYFCRYCSDLRCGCCVSHEVDSHYCPNCLENMPSAEARLKKNRCANCFDCPSCGHTLSTRATSMTVAPQQQTTDAGDAAQPTKVI